MKNIDACNGIGRGQNLPTDEMVSLVKIFDGGVLILTEIIGVAGVSMVSLPPLPATEKARGFSSGYVVFRHLERRARFQK